jgi:hypothetical protein
MARRYGTLITAFIFVLCTPGFAQEVATTEFEFKVFGVGHDDYEGLYYRSGKGFTPLEFHRTHRSMDTYTYEGPVSFGIYVKNPSYVPTNPESQPFIKVSESLAPIDAKHQLILFAASPLNRGVEDPDRRFTLFHIDDSPEAFPRNTIIVVNTTGAELHGRVAEARISLPKSYSEAIPYTSKHSSGSTRIAFALETQEGPRLVMSNEMDLAENRRVLLILEPPRRAGSLRLAARMLSQSIFPEDGEGTTD